MVFKFDFGNENIDGRLVPAPLDEKHIVTDFIDDFLFEGNVVHDPSYEEEMVGYVKIGNIYNYCVAIYARKDNWLRYWIPNAKFLDKDDLDEILARVKETFECNDNLTIEVISTELIKNRFDCSFILFFYTREE